MHANLILGVTGSLITLVLLFELLRRQRLREKYAVLWVIVSVATLIVAAAPDTLYWLSGIIGVKVPSNLLFFGASLVLLFITVQHSLELGRLEERTRTLAEELALLQVQFDRNFDISPSRSPELTQANN